MARLDLANRRTGERGNRGIGQREKRRGQGRENARALALDILQRVEATDAYANVLLDVRLRKSQLAGPDRALATELVYGVLRWRGKLDWILAQVLDRPIEALDRPVRHILRLGVYQLRCLTRIPDFAVVDEAVHLARWARATKSAGYVNAVLRSVARRRDDAGPDPTGDPIAYWSSAGSHPRWLVERWIARLGAVEAGQLMAANNEVPPVTVLVNTLKAQPDEVHRALTGAVASVVPGRWIADAFCLRGTGDLAHLPGFAEGWFLPMDEAGALPVLALDLAPGQRVLDACAGGGSKSALIAAWVGTQGEVVALDNNPRALRRLQAAIIRLGLDRVQPHLTDARTAGSLWPGRFDRVLLDAPCTGLGTIRRRPEIKWRRQPDDLSRARALQGELLAGVAGVVARGGLLVYSTCSLEPEETEQVISTFLAAHPEFMLDDPSPVLRGAAEFEAGRGLLTTWPHRHGTDGFFVARLRRSR